jgi:thiol-disulfide isomerase/thioredoxin
MRIKLLMFMVVCISLLVHLSFSNRLQASSEKATPFTLEDLTGNPVSLSDFRGRVVVIDFWATWCHECETSSPQLEKVYRTYKDQGVVFLGISLDEGSDAKKEVKSFVERFDLTFIVLMGNSKVAGDYYIKGIPTTYVLDRDHTIIARYEGSLYRLGEMISSKIEDILH